MHVIHKFTFADLHHPKVVDIPASAQVLAVGTQNGGFTGYVVMWVRLDPDDERVARTFQIVGTGHDFAPNLVYHGTTQVGPYVWHVMEQPR